MKRKFLPFIITFIFTFSFLVPLSLGSSVSAARPAPATNTTTATVQAYSGHTDADCSLLGFVAWDCKIGPMNTEATIRSGIWQIAANIATDISVAAAYLVLGYTIYGGYLYMLSGGDATKVAAGKRTLSHAFIGLAITMLASTIMSTIRVVLAANNGNLSCDFTTSTGCVTTNAQLNQMVTNIIQWFFGFAGVVAVVFVLIGGVSYMTSAGNPSQTQKAKQTITYALIGLVIVALAEVITGFVSNLIRNADTNANTTSLTSPPPSYLDDSSLALHHNASENIDINPLILSYNNKTKEPYV